MKIGSFDFSKTEDVYICAEIGINHNGSMEIARQLIDIAANCGCEGVKFQKRTPGLCVPEHQKDIPRETPWGIITYLEYRHKVEFSADQICELGDYARSKDIDWMVSVWDEQSLVEMVKLKPAALKLPSALLNDHEMIKSVKETGIPLIWSTGMSTNEEIDISYKLICEVPNIMCHCNASYPAELKELNLSFLQVMQERYNKSIIGYSGHEVALLPTIISTVLGARYVERHITLGRALWGTDQAASVEPQGLMRMVKEIRTVKVVLGVPEKILFESEKVTRKKLRMKK